MKKLNRIVIIGAGAAGLTTAETVRRLGFGGDLMMVHAERTPPVAAYYEEGERLVAVLGWNSPKHLLS